MDTQVGAGILLEVEPERTLTSTEPTASEQASAYSHALGERIRLCRGTKNRKEFGEALHLHVNTIGKLERGETLPDAFTLLKIAEFGGRSVQWLLTGAEGGTDPGDVGHSVHAVQHGQFVYVPHFDISASAGNGDLFTHLESVVAMRPFDQAYIRGELGIGHDEIAMITVIGNSMEPHLHSRDSVLIDLRAGHENFTDGIYVIRLDDSLLVKQVQRLPGRVFRISSSNEDYAPFEVKVREDAQRDFSIIGRVRWGGVTFK
jgi:phage repressor protein C with HTH and peptisase S24 domain